MMIDDNLRGHTVDIAARSGALIEVRSGHSVRIIDVEGSQVADMFAASAADPREFLSVSVTRGVNWRLFPTTGQPFMSTSYRPMLTFERDDTPGCHDMLAAPCSPGMYRALGFEGHHPSCSENFRMAAETVDWRPAHVPDPVNFFQRTPVDADSVITAEAAPTEAGDSVTLRALMDLYVVVTSCSMDLKEINGGGCTGLRLALQP